MNDQELFNYVVELEQNRLEYGRFIQQIAEALGVPEVFGGGYEEDAILLAIKTLKEKANG
jgi:hypothetical protein